MTEIINEDSVMEQLVVCSLANEEYAIHILQVQEINKLIPITRVPQVPDYIAGVMNLRGSIVPVIDLKQRIALPATCVDENYRIVIVQSDDSIVGLIVDAVLEVISIDSSQIDKSQTLLSETTGQFISGIGKHDNRLLIILDVESIMNINI